MSFVPSTHDHIGVLLQESALAVLQVVVPFPVIHGLPVGFDVAPLAMLAVLKPLAFIDGSIEVIEPSQSLDQATFEGALVGADTIKEH